jgi:inorganic pyrophosphatase
VPSTKLTQRYDKIKTLSDLPSITLNQIEHFFAHYKDLEPNKWVKIKEMGDAALARSLIGDSIVRARDAGKRKA